MAVVKEIKSGVNTVRICDDIYINRSESEVRESIQRASNLVHSVARRLEQQKGTETA